MTYPPLPPQFFHLVAAQGLRRAAAASAPSCASFEHLLAEVEAAREAGGRGQQQLRQHPGMTRLLRRPEVFTLAVVWDSPQVGESGGVA